MALLINNDVAARVLTMADAVDAMERVLGQYAEGLATCPVTVQRVYLTEVSTS